MWGYCCPRYMAWIVRPSISSIYHRFVRRSYSCRLRSCLLFVGSSGGQWGRRFKPHGSEVVICSPNLFTVTKVCISSLSLGEDFVPCHPGRRKWFLLPHTEPGGVTSKDVDIALIKLHDYEWGKWCPLPVGRYILSLGEDFVPCHPGRRSDSCCHTPNRAESPPKNVDFSSL